MRLRPTESAKTVVQIANQEAMRFGHDYIGTEHLLIGIAEEKEGLGGQVLRSLGMEATKFRQEIGSLPQTLEAPGNSLGHPRARTILGFALDEARRFNHTAFGSEHLLLGILRERPCAACSILANLGLNLAELEAELGKRIIPPLCVRTRPQGGTRKAGRESSARPGTQAENR